MNSGNGSKRDKRRFAVEEHWDRVEEECLNFTRNDDGLLALIGKCRSRFLALLGRHEPPVVR